MNQKAFHPENTYGNYDLRTYPELFGTWKYSKVDGDFRFSDSITEFYFSDLKGKNSNASTLFDQKSWFRFISRIKSDSIITPITLPLHYKSTSYSIVLFNISHSEVNIEGFCSIIKYSAIDNSTLNPQNDAKFRTIGKMAGCIAHEISNPLSIIRMNAEILFSSESLYNNPEKVKEKCEKIISTSDRVASIVRALRSINASTQKCNFSWVYLSDLAKDILELSKYHFKEQHIKIDFNLNNLGEEKFYLDYAQITQALINLINNASDAINHKNEKWILINCHTDNENLLIEVLDSGECLATENFDKIRSDLFSTKSANGLGLGLGLVQAYLSTHGGHLEYQPKNNNTCFVICLPLHRIKPENKS